jgi:hypothetical protein
MIVILGLVILAGALVAGAAGVLANGGHAHAVTHFAVFGYHVTGADRDDLRGQRDTARAYTVRDEQRNFTASTLGDDGTDPDGTDPGLRGPSLPERPLARQPTPPPPDALASQAPAA